MIPALAFAAIGPALLVMWFVHARDAYPEPPRLVWTTFVLGALCVFPASILNVQVEALARALGWVNSPWTFAWINAFPGAAIPEELMKFWVLAGYALRRREFDEPMDGLVYGVATAMGFAAIENLVYVFHHGLETAVVRGLTAVPFHGSLGAVMGYFAALARFRPERRSAFLFRALAIPIMLHGLYDFPLMAADHLPRGSGLVVGLNLLMFAVASIGLGFSLALIRRFQGLQGIGSETAQPYETLDHHHGPDSAARRIGPWLRIAFGGVLLWVASLMLAGWLMANLVRAAPSHVQTMPIPFMIFFGAVLFRSGIRGLNTREHGEA